MNLYQELELPTDSTLEMIKQKYRILASRHHPDKGGDAEKFKRIQKAYDVLSDPERKKIYDETGKYNINPTTRAQAFEIISQMVLNIAPNINPETQDLILSMKVEVNNMKKAAIHDINVCSAYISNLNKILARVKRKDDGENIISGMLHKQLDQRNSELLQFKTKLEICELITEILEDYHYNIQEWTLFLGSK